MPFGLSGAPLPFQRLINSVFSGLIGNSVFSFLDDVIIASKDAESHLQKLEEALNWLKSVGLALKLTKRMFLKKQIAFLGHVLDSDWTHTTLEKVTAVQNFPTPINLKTLHFLEAKWLLPQFCSKLFHGSKARKTITQEGHLFHVGIRPKNCL